MDNYGNPQLGAAKDVPLENRKIFNKTGTQMGTLVECEFCHGLYWAICPCGGVSKKDQRRQKTMDMLTPLRVMVISIVIGLLIYAITHWG